MKKLFMILVLVGAVGLSGCHVAERGRVRTDLYGSYGYPSYGRVYADPFFYPPYYSGPYYSPFFFSSGFFIHPNHHVVIGDHGGFRPGRSLRGGTLGHRGSGSHGGAGSHGGSHGGGHR